MKVEGGLVTSYSDLRRYLLTQKPKNSTQMLPAYAVVHQWLEQAREATSYLSWNKTLMDFVLWLGKRDGPKCPAGRVKVTFCLDASTCVTGESVWLLKG